MTDQEYQAAIRYWEEKDASGVKLETSKLRAMVEEYIQSNNTCALATGTGDYVRCTPIEYSWHEGCFWMFSEVYNTHAAWKKISLEVLRRLPSPMHLIRIRPTRIDCLFSDFKAMGCAPRQTLLLDETEGQ